MTDDATQSSRLRPGSLGVTGIVVLSAVLMGPAISLFFNTPVVAGNAGAAVPLVFILAMVGVLLTAWTVAQYSRKISGAGSFYGFIQRAAGARLGFMAGWATFGAYLGAAIGGAAISGAFISDLLARHASIDIPWIWLALAVVAVVLALSIIGIRISERVGLVMLGIELLAVAIVVIAILVQGGDDGFSTKPFTFDGAPNGLDGIRLAMVFGVLSFVGFEISATLAEETREPRRNVPRAVIGCTLVVGLLYVIGSYAVTIGYGVDNIDQLASDPAAFDTLTARYVTSASVIVDLILINALIGATLAVTNGFARVAFALGRNGAIPSWFGRTSARYATPVNALAVCGLMSIVFLVPLSIDGQNGLTAYTWVSTPAILLLILVFIAANLTVGRFYWTKHKPEFRWASHVLVPVLGALVMLLPITAQFWPTPPSPQDRLPWITLAWLVIGVVVMVAAGSRLAGAFDAEAASGDPGPDDGPPAVAADDRQPAGRA
ncbi:APC family permease [Capillimicrobium parvum]|uniref:Putrescine importer PuuP n=1 Tax=Capillimicrobium parvum TaxID=2884022 RepID=A0A9E7C060_9ACTN|nr:APC family permease [Capillimicrobium parvum]UGS35279.1 Putrescine importer PuuP [Capillimicrobium parvum]